VLVPGGNDERKNLTRIVEAFYRMDASVRAGTHLVIGGSVQDHVVEDVRHAAEAQGGSLSDVVFTGFITDEALKVLYRRCALFVFPSWHEGFGLPALEAMVLGAPVITGASPGLRDVVGWNEATFDPLNVAEMSNLMQRALRDREFSGLLRANARSQVGAFSWDITATKALDAWRKLVNAAGASQKIGATAHV
jgi:glycosyltransferase involved in cell wall biosynthesis